MKILLVILLSLWCELGQAEIFSISLAGKARAVEIQKFSDIHLSRTCLRKGETLPECQAYGVLSKKIKSRSVGALLANPAESFCRQMGGQPRVLLNNVSTEFDYCEFPDKSLIDAWDLYLHFHAKK